MATTQNLSEWNRHDALADGMRVLVRPLRPQDGALYPDFIAHVTIVDTRLRFFAPIRELSEQRIAELTRLDYTRAMAFIAISEATGEMLGVVRLHLDADSRGGGARRKHHDAADVPRPWLPRRRRPVLA